MTAPDLGGRTALVTGSAKGIGREILLAFAECGARTAAHYHTSETEAATVERMACRRGAKAATTVRADVTDPDEVDDAFDAIETELGPVDILVNNVGTFEPAYWEDVTIDTWNRVLGTNLTGTFLCSRRAVPRMRERGYGRIVNVGYAGCERGLVWPMYTPYAIAKAGVLVFTRMLAAETQNDGITVNSISPYVVENSVAVPDDLPRDRPASYDDVIFPVLFLVDERADYISGTNIPIDGGWLPERF